MKKRELTALEIHELTDLPRTKIYELAQMMIRRGMCIEKQMGRRKKYQAVAPKRALNNLIQEYTTDLNEKKRLAKDITRIIHPAYSQGMQIQGVPEYVEVIKGRQSIHERYVNLVKMTKKELLGFVKRPYTHKYNRQKMGEQENVEFKILKRGAVARVLYEFPSEEEREDRIAHIEKCIQAGEKARLIKHLPIKMYIFDQRYVLMALEHPKLVISPITMLVIDHQGLAKATRIAFDSLWKKAKDYRDFGSLSKGRVKVET